MKLRLLLLSSLLVSFTFQDSPEETSWKAIAAADGQQVKPESRKLLQHFIKTYPKSSHLPDALLQLSMTYGESPDEKAAALDCLRRLNNDYPRTNAAAVGEQLIDSRAGWNRSRIDSHPGPGENVGCDFVRHAGPDSTYSLIYIPTPTFLKALKELAFDDERGVDLQALRDKGSAIKTYSQVFSRGANEPGLLRRKIELNLKWAGFYVIEEVVDGFHFFHPLPVNTFAIICNALPKRPLVYLVNQWTGAPLAGVKVELLMKDKTLEATTTAGGVAPFEVPDGTGRLLVQHENQAVSCTVHFEKKKPESRVFISTDRPVYRPGQSVFFKAIRRDVDGTALTFKAGEKIRVEVRDPSDRLLQATDLAWSDTGTLSGSFKLGDEPPLGTYYVQVNVPCGEVNDDESSFWKKGFLVSEYRKPEYQVSVEFADAAPSTSTKIAATIRGEYYFGGPVAGADVKWTVTTGWPRPRYGDKPRPPFEDPRAWCYEDEAEEAPFYGENLPIEGTGKTGPDGKLAISFEQTAESHEMEYEVRAEMRDVSRLAAEGSGRVTARPSSLCLSIGANRVFYKPGEMIQARLRVTTPAGSPAKNQNVEIAAFIAKETDEDREFESIFTGSAKTDDQGYASFDVPAERGGKLRLRGRAKDKEGRVAEDRSDLWIAGDDTIRPSQDNELLVLPDKAVYEEGETAHFLLRTYTTPMTLLMSVEGGILHETQTVTMKHRSEIVDLPVRAAFCPNVYVKFWGWANGGGIRSGFEISVLPKKSFIDVAISTDRVSYGPRQKAKVTLSTRLGDQPEPAEVEVAIVDESIFAIEKDSTADIRLFFRPFRVDESSDFGTAYVWNDNQNTYRRKGQFYSGGAITLTGATFGMEEGGGIGGGPAPAMIRSRFADTFHYAAHVKTGKDGTATLDLETPDTLTTWRIVARAHSGTDRFGAGKSSTLTRKDVILRLATPRFYTERDSGVISTIVQSDLNDDTEFTVRLKLEGAEGESGDRKVRVPAHGQTRLDWKVKITKPGVLKIHAEALSKAESDGVEIEIPIRTHGIEKQDFAAGKVVDAWRTSLTVPDDARAETATMDIVVTSSNAAAITEALPWLAGYPYGCVEQTMSRFLPAVVASQAMKRLKIPNAQLDKELPTMVEMGLQRLYHFQHSDGAWGWWTDDATNPFMTAYVIFGLATAKQAGFAVDEKTFKVGLESLRAMEPTPFALLARATAGDDVSELLKAAKPKDTEEWAFLVLAGRTDLAGAMPVAVPQKAGPDQIRAMAMAARAIFKLNPRDEKIATLNDWLLANRRSGSWYSTLDTAWVILALTDIAATDKEPDVHIKVNGREIASKAGRVSVAGLKAGENAIEVTQKGGRSVFATAALHYFSKAENMAPERGAFVLTRRFERAVVKGGVKGWEFLESGAQVKTADELRVTIDVSSEAPESYMMMESPLPAGTEAREDEADDYDWFSSWYGRRELRDDRVSVAAQHVGVETRSFTFRLRPTLPGEYHVMPAVAFSMYEPDHRGTSGEFLLRVVDK